MSRETTLLVAIWAILMAALAVTVAAAVLPIGPIKTVINLGAALIKAGLIYWVFMHLREVGGFLRIAALGAVVWVLLLGGMLYTDIISRS